LIMVQNTIIAGFLGGYEWIVIVLVVILLFGGRKIPELAKGLGKGIKEFRSASKELKDEIKDPETKTSDEK
jgi:sec-independent protein translocase protein TatA